MTLTLRKPTEAAPKRLAALAKLPVFWDLGGKRVVLAGGTAAAAWKAELLAAAGAHVEVFAISLEPEMEALIARGAAAGSIMHCPVQWSPDAFTGSSLALADADSDAEAECFYAAAVQAGVPVNVIDKPAYCQFQFGSIVNRSPVVVGISTDGAAPILGQAVRRRIETLLPSTLSDWAKLAKAARQSIMQKLGAGAERRAFWERFSELAFRRPAPADGQRFVDEAALEAKSGASRKHGRVTLVGAGPGNAELLTMKAVRVLQAADIILFDDLVSDEVLELARREAKRMMVGKRGQRASCSQEDINALMVKLAQQGKHVVRLKSGDPMIFGRAGEEIERLARAGIPVDVVPGITAASALASDLRTSLTHRDRAHSVRYVTGHSRSGLLPDDIDWQGVADPATTLVFYMGGRTAPDIARKLIAEGLSPATPVSIASSISRPEMKVQVAKLEALTDPGFKVSSSGPVLVAVGEVFKDVQVRDSEELTSGLEFQDATVSPGNVMADDDLPRTFVSQRQ
ncbi:MAG: siroheme synthase CysG [Pseudomonadota bacterium]